MQAIVPVIVVVVLYLCYFFFKKVDLAGQLPVQVRAQRVKLVPGRVHFFVPARSTPGGIWLSFPDSEVPGYADFYWVQILVGAISRHVYEKSLVLVEDDEND